MTDNPTPHTDQPGEGDKTPEIEEPLQQNRALVPLSEAQNGTGSFRGNLLSWLYRVFTGRKNGSSVRENLADALSEGEAIEQGFSPEEREMLTSILRLRDARVEDIMVPRADIIAVNQEISLGELLKLFESSGHSRMPVYGDTLDDPKGMVHIRDVVGHFLKTSALTKSEIKRRKLPLPANLDLKRVKLAKPISALKLVRDVLFVPPSMPATELMARMQADRMQIALVIDEYGGTDGLVTLEDIVEEIVGEIEDEHDDDAELIEERGDGAFLCGAKAELDEIRELVGEDFIFPEHEEDVDTLGGLIFAITGRVPVRGEVIITSGFEFRVIEADPRRIKRIELLRSTRRRFRKI